jgi:transposase-like protein
MTKNRIPGNPTKDGVFPQTESIAVDLPPPETKRWVSRRKAAIVNAVLSGAVSLEEVCRRYELSVEEFITWQRAIEAHGVAGLRVTRLQVYRHARPTQLGSGAS